MFVQSQMMGLWLSPAGHISHDTEDFLKSFTVKEIVSAGSSLKFCLLATGEADIYPAMGAQWSGIQLQPMHFYARQAAWYTTLTVGF